MEYKVEKMKNGRYGLYLLYADKGWVLHKSYMTEAGADVAAKILWEQGFSSTKTPALPPI